MKSVSESLNPIMRTIPPRTFFPPLDTLWPTRRGLALLCGLCWVISVGPLQTAAVEIAISSPAQGQTFVAPGSVTLGAVVSGPVQWVDFYHGGILVGWAESEPYTFEWTGLAAGEYAVEARATDAAGETTVSTEVWFQVVGESTVRLTRGPYVMMAHVPHQSTLVWRTDPPSDGWVEYGLTTAYGLAAGAPVALPQHEVTLTGLESGRSYHYRIRSGGRVLATAEFRSAKPPGTPLRVAWTADHRSGAGGPLANVMKATKPDLILDAGDLMSWCDATRLDEEFFASFGGVLSQSPFYWTPGNHEWSDCEPCLEAFDALPEDHQSYSIEYGDLQAIALNSCTPPPASWLREKLAGSTKPWKVVFTHYPMYSAFGGHGDEDGWQLREDYLPIMEEYKVAACITGHNHYYWRSLPIRGVTHLVVGSGGAPMYWLGGLPSYTAGANDTAQVFSSVDIAGDFMHVRSLDHDGLLVDETVLDRRCAFQVDGLLDATAFRLTDCPGGLELYAAIGGRYLYVAIPNAVGDDHFVFLSQSNSPTLRSLETVWGKWGQVMAYDAFLAGHGASQSNGWFNWFGQPFGDLTVARSATRLLKDGLLEGVIDLQALYGTIPPVLHLAAAAFEPGLGGEMRPARQCPPGNGNNQLEPVDFLAVNTAAITLPSCDRGPVISGQPRDVTVSRGQPASFQVTVCGADPLVYQWRKEGTNLAGAVGAVYGVASTGLADAGGYDVVVSNSFGTVTSAVAHLILNLPPLPNGRLVLASLPPDGPVLLVFEGEPNALYDLEVSEDLRSWYPLSTESTDPTGRLEWSDAEITLYPAKFYRTRFVGSW